MTEIVVSMEFSVLFNHYSIQGSSFPTVYRNSMSLISFTTLRGFEKIVSDI